MRNKMNKFVIGQALAALGALSSQAATVTGTVLDLTLQSGNDTGTGAFVIPSVRSSSLVSLQLNDLISPNGSMKVSSSTVQVPGNAYVPSQNIMYYIIPVPVSKLSYTSVLNTGTTNELAALEFWGQASEILSVIQSKKPVTRILPYVHFESMGFESDRDWAQVTGATDIAVNMTPQSNLKFAWSRAAAPSNAQDAILAFQQTPAGRWMLTDLQSPGAATGQLHTQASFKARAKVFFMRFFDSTVSGDQTPGSAVGTLVDTAVPNSVTAPALPAGFAGTSVSSGGLVSWTPIAQTGWVAVLTGGSGSLGLDMPLLRGLLPENESANLSFPSVVAWVSPAAGSYQLTAPLGTSTVSLAYFGTDRAVPAPTALASIEDEPELFTYANQIRYIRIP